MSDQYFTVNLRTYLDKDEPTYIGEESLSDLLADFLDFAFGVEDMNIIQQPIQLFTFLIKRNHLLEYSRRNMLPFDNLSKNG